MRFTDGNYKHTHVHTHEQFLKYGHTHTQTHTHKQTHAHARKEAFEHTYKHMETRSCFRVHAPTRRTLIWHRRELTVSYPANALLVLGAVLRYCWQQQKSLPDYLKYSCALSVIVALFLLMGPFPLPETETFSHRATGCSILPL